MTIEHVIALTIGFIFGWLGELYESRRKEKKAYLRGMFDGFSEMTEIANAFCKRCEESGEPDPVSFEFGPLSKDDDGEK